MHRPKSLLVSEHRVTENSERMKPDGAEGFTSMRGGAVIPRPLPLVSLHPLTLSLHIHSGRPKFSLPSLSVLPQTAAVTMVSCGVCSLANLQALLEQLHVLWRSFLTRLHTTLAARGLHSHAPLPAPSVAL